MIVRLQGSLTSFGISEKARDFRDKLKIFKITMNQQTQAFRAARDFLLQHRDDYAAAYARFQRPKLDRFNWALDWFDVIVAQVNVATRRRCG